MNHQKTLDMVAISFPYEACTTFMRKIIQTNQFIITFKRNDTVKITFFNCNIVTTDCPITTTTFQYIPTYLPKIFLSIGNE